MKTIYKYPLAPITELMLPADATVLTVATQNGVPCLWVELDPTAAQTRRRFVSYGTGHMVEPGGTYVGTAHDVEGVGLVFHVYETSPP